ncbi:MAG TPA: hypothetical protein VE987_08180 [Polyangiaceae bacterium]|nr:hypothetical protein [Polyangiaceae bacterium]
MTVSSACEAIRDLALSGRISALSAYGLLQMPCMTPDDFARLERTVVLLFFRRPLSPERPS